MKQYTKFKEAVRCNERRQHTKKAKKAHKYLIYAIAFMLTVEILISGMQPKTFQVEGKPMSVDVREISEVPNVETAQDVVSSEKRSDGQATGGIEKLIAEKFPEQKDIVRAVFQAESGLRTDAMGWNCYYNGRSQACKPEDRHKAWSVDCGVAQINIKGKTCPAELFDPAYNLEIARKKYDTKQGLNHWYAFKNQLHLKFLN